MDGGAFGAGGVAPATSIQKATDSTEAQSYRDRWGQCISKFPGRDIESFEKDAMGDHGGQPSAERRPVKDDAAIPNLEEFQERVFDCVSILDKVKNAGADQSTDERPEDQILDTIAWHSFAFPASPSQPHCDHEDNEQHYPEAVNGHIDEGDAE
jgi:hypothetical protein